MSLFTCPVCGEKLILDNRRYVCQKGHSFDLAKEGHTYLLPANRKNSKMPGDDKGMANARRNFLNHGYYEPLRSALCHLSVQYTGNQLSVLDCGCGEGYYSDGIYDALTSCGKEVQMAGIDISKEILRLAAKRTKKIEFAVASSYHLPIADNSIDLLLNCFSPLAIDEFLRVLKSGGLFLYVVPSEKHLWEMKDVLYDHPYPNEVKETPYDGFTYVTIHHVESVIHMLSQDDIHFLFQMTPYYWKTPRQGKERLAALDQLDVTISFDIHVFKKL